MCCHARTIIPINAKDIGIITKIAMIIAAMILNKSISMFLQGFVSDSHKLGPETSELKP